MHGNGWVRPGEKSAKLFIIIHVRTAGGMLVGMGYSVPSRQTEKIISHLWYGQ